MDGQLEAAKKLRDEGLSYAQIGKQLGVSRQRIHQILKDYSSPYGGKPVREWFRENYLGVKDPETGKKINLKVKKRPRPDDTCELCEGHSERLNYHHWDNGNYLRGVWVCPVCHYFIHGIEAGCIEKGLHLKYIRLKGRIENEAETIRPLL